MRQSWYEADQGSVEVEEISVDEERRRLDVEARRVLNVSGEELRSRWLAGKFREHGDPKVAQLAILLPDAW
ncbi:MAG TPA: hypothetical protein VLJ59_13785 [Mycobacteriales bacterium]|nr:hypothetical protein [Mycobacteriales bacterium]